MSGKFGRPRRPWKALVALAAIAGTTVGGPLAAPAGAVVHDTDCDGLQAALSAAGDGDTVRLAAGSHCFGYWEMPMGISITLEGASGGATPILDGSQNRVEGEGIAYERILRAHDVRSSTIRNLVFQNGNYSGRGGAIKVQGDSAATIDGVTFIGNFARGGGGALSVRPDPGWGPNTITNSTFQGRDATEDELPNLTPRGGALYIDTQDPVIVHNNRFLGNMARFFGGAVAVQARGDTTITITENQFTENSVEVPACFEGSDYGGGGLGIEGESLLTFSSTEVSAAAADDNRPDVVQRANSFTGNVVETDVTNGFCNGAFSAQAVYYGDYYGGGELVRNAVVSSRDDRFVDNVVSNVIEEVGFGEAEGGGLSIENSFFDALPFTAENLVLAGNEALGLGVGGGAYFGRAGGVQATLLHATVVANHADSTGGGLAGGDVEGLDELTLANSIVWGNTADGNDPYETGFTPHDDIADFAAVTANFSDLCLEEGQTLEAGSGDNICADPKLVAPATGDVHQTATSPTLDAASAALTGTLDKDYEGQARIQDSDGDGPRPSAPDMGADEMPAPTPVPVIEDPKVEGELIAPGSIGEDDGYCQAAQDGGVFAFGGCQFLGAAGGDRVRATSNHITAPQSLQKLNAPIVSIAMQPSDTGYWQAATDGGVFSFGTAPFLGSMGGTKLNNPIVGIATSPTGKGYYLVASDGGVFGFGDAPFLGSMGGTPLTRPIVGIAATPTGKGYWLVASDGGVFSFGDARFHGSTGGQTLNSPIVGMASRPGGLGYWLAAADGGVFTFGDAPFLGNRVGQQLNAPITGIKGAASGLGYWLIAGDGGIFSYGSAPFLGSMGNTRLNQPVVDMTG